jgi:hypothetical protein
VQKRVISHERAKQRAKDGVIEAEFEETPVKIEQNDAGMSDAQS